MGAPYQLLVRDGENSRSVALVQDGRLLEYFSEEADSIVGSILLGRVERVLPDIKAAFVKIGLPLNGFLPLKETDSFHQTCGKAPLMSGQEILVQVKKAPKGGKGAFLTRDIALPGQYVLLMPQNRFVGLSKRITEESDRERARRIGRQAAQERFGVIVRHAALFASEDEVRQEAEELWTLWQDISSRAACAKAPLLMHREASMEEVLQRDYSARHPVETCAEEELWRRYRIDDQVRAALARKVELPNGSSLVIDEREALQTVDVNSGRVVKASVSLPLEENLLAVGEIARQIRLRNLSGIILIDFIDMDTEQERRQVQEAMENAVRDDRVKTVIHGFTRLGLLEMTRKRTSDSLRDALTIPCGTCRESGRILTAE